MKLTETFLMDSDGEKTVYIDTDLLKRLYELSTCKKVFL